MSDWSTKPGVCGPRSEYLYCITILLASHVDPDLLLLMNMRYQLSLADNDKEATITTRAHVTDYGERPVLNMLQSLATNHTIHNWGMESKNR